MTNMQNQIANKISKSVIEKYESSVNPITSLEFEVLLTEVFKTSDLASLLSIYTSDEIAVKIEMQMAKDCE